MSSSIDLCWEILFSISEAGLSYKEAPKEIVTFQWLAQGHFSRVDALQCVGFKDVSVIIYTTILICVG